jgi:hypothetical protein
MKVKICPKHTTMNDKSKRSPSGVSQPDSPSRDAAVISLLNSDDESPVVAVTKKAKMVSCDDRDP